MFSVYLQCAPIQNLKNTHQEEWKANIIKTDVKVDASDEIEALHKAKERLPQFGNRLMVK